MFKEPEIKDCAACGMACCLDCIPKEDASVLECLDKEDLHYLMSCKRRGGFKPGETIIKQNTSTTHFVCMKDGLAKVVAEGVNGKNVIVKLLSNHSMVTAGGVLSEDIRQFTITALTKVECCFVDANRLHTLLSRNSKFAYELLKYNNKQHIQMVNTLVGMTQKYMPGRVADTLLYLKNEIYHSNPFTYTLSKQEFAEMSDMTKESFIRNMKELEVSGIIKQSRNAIEILNETELVKISKNG